VSIRKQKVDEEKAISGLCPWKKRGLGRSALKKEKDQEYGRKLGLVKTQEGNSEEEEEKDRVNEASKFLEGRRERGALFR